MCVGWQIQKEGPVYQESLWGVQGCQEVDEDYVYSPKEDFRASPGHC